MFQPVLQRARAPTDREAQRRSGAHDDRFGALLLLLGEEARDDIDGGAVRGAVRGDVSAYAVMPSKSTDEW
jgi:hypothetical protein